MKYDLILLDLDGTILDYKTSELKTLQLLFKELHIEFKDEYYKKYVEINENYWKRLENGEIEKAYLTKNRFKDFFHSIGIKNDTDENAIYLKHLSLCDDTIEGAIELVRSISSKVKLIAATNGIQYVQHSRLKTTGFDKYFDEVITSEEVGYEKPRKEFFDFCLSKYPDVKKDRILMVGDSINADILGAINYKIDSCWFNPSGKTTKHKPTFTITELSELMDIILL